MSSTLTLSGVTVLGSPSWSCLPSLAEMANRASAPTQRAPHKRAAITTLRIPVPNLMFEATVGPQAALGKQAVRLNVQLTDFVEKLGAGEANRTPDPNLGKVGV